MKDIHNIRLRGKSKIFFIKEIFETITDLVTKRKTASTETLLSSLNDNFRSALLSMYRGEPQLGIDGQKHPIDMSTKLSPRQGMWLYQLCREIKPENTLEIGMAFGYSTIYILAAISENETGHHTAIDPYQTSFFHGIGLAHMDSLDEVDKSNFQMIEDKSDRVATDLARSDSEFDLILIDGNHLFDSVIVDFVLYAPLCSIGGYIIFDDMWMRSVRTAVSYVENNRTDFVQIKNDEFSSAIFQKISEDSRQWDDFHRFSVSL